RQINTTVFNADGRRESRELLDRLKNSDTFHIIRYVENDGDLNDAIIAGKARVGIKIPVDYSDRLLHNMSAQVLVLIDGSDSSVAGQAINVTTAIGLDESLRRVLQDRASFPVSSFLATSFRARPCPSSSTSSAISFLQAITSTSPAASSCAAPDSLIFGSTAWPSTPWAPSFFLSPPVVSKTKSSWLNGPPS